MKSFKFFIFSWQWPSFALVIFLVMQSCQLNQEIASPFLEFSVENSFQAASQNFDIVPSAWNQEQWWNLYQDPQLSSLIQESLKHNPGLQATYEKVSFAQAQAKIAFAPMLPQIDAAFEEFFAGFTWNKRGIDPEASLFPDSFVPKWINFLSTLINFKWSIDIWGKQKKLYRAVIDESKMQMAEASYAGLILSTQMASAYFNLQYLQATQQLQQDYLENMVQQLSLIEAIVNNGLLDQRSINEMQQQISSFESAILKNDQEISLCLNQIKALIGISADESLNLQQPTSYISQRFPLPEQLPLNLIARRADVVAKLWAATAAAKRVKSAQLEYLPNIDLASFSGYLNLNWDTLLKPRGWFSSILPTASLPLFKGLQVRSKIQLQAHRYNIAIQEYNQTLIEAAKEVVDAICLFRFSNLQLDNQTTVLDQSQNLVELATLRYENGLNNALEVLKARSALIKNEMRWCELTHMHMLSSLNIIKAIGGGYQNQDLPTLKEEVFVENGE